MSVYHHYTHIVNTFSSVEGATTPTLKNAPSILSPLCSSLWPFGVFFWPFAGGSGPFDLGPAPLRLGTCATSWTEVVYWSPRRGLFPSSSGHKRGSLGFALPLLRGTDRLMTTKSLAGTIYNIVWLSGLSFFWSAAQHFFFCVKLIKYYCVCLEPR